MASSIITKVQMDFIKSMIDDYHFFIKILNKGDRDELRCMNEGVIIDFHDRKHLNKIRQKWIKYKS